MLAQARTLLDHCANHRLGSLFAVALPLGLRLGEALGLRWSDVNFSQELLHVRRMFQRIKGGVAFSTSKTARSYRTLVLPASGRTGVSEFESRRNPSCAQSWLQCEDRSATGVAAVELLFFRPRLEPGVGPTVALQFAGMDGGRSRRRYFDGRVPGPSLCERQYCLMLWRL